MSERVIGILGGSFDPPHCGHVLLGAYALSVAPISELLIVPTFRHPFGKPLAPFEDRMQMCELAFSRLGATTVSAIEASLPTPSYTVVTLDTISRAQPGARLRLIMGTDVERSLPSWHRANEVITLAPPWVARRTVVDGDPEGGMLPNVSSTEIRARMARGADTSALVPRTVLEHCLSRGLYR